MWHYRADEVDVISGSGIPASAQQTPTIYVNKSTGVLYFNVGGGSSTWTSGGSGNVETLIAARVLVLGDNNKTFYLDIATGFDITLPAQSAGLHFTFIVKTAPTTAYTVTSVVSDTISGWPINCGGADSVADGNAAGDVLNFAANVALPGDFAEFWADGTSWYVHAHAKTIHGITITG